jgi:hypothetical protein
MRTPRRRLPSMTAVKGIGIVDLEAGEGRIKHFPARYDDDIDAGRDLMTPEDLPREALGAIPFNRGTELPAGRYAESRDRPAVGNNEERHETRRNPNARRIRPLEIRSAANPLDRRESERRNHGYCSSDTVKRLRPLARRLLRTIRPFFVAIRTLKPCVFARRRVFG